MHAPREHISRQGHRAKRYQYIQEAFQRYLYQHAEFIVKNKWRLIIGYLSVLPILGITILLTFGLQHVVDRYVFENSILVLAFSITALWWGAGPALLLMFLGTIILDFFLIAPVGQLELIMWPNVLQLLPLGLTSIVIGILSFQRDKGWVKTQMRFHDLAVTKQKIEEAAQLKDHFLSMTSHELKTPVTGIRMQAQLLQRQLKKQSPTEETDLVLQALKKIDGRTQALTNMVDELLDFSRIQSHKTTFKRQVLDMNVLCEEVVEEQQLVTGRAILFRGSATPAPVYGDCHRLTQVVSNLVNNAIKYSPVSTPVEVSVDQDAQHVIVQIIDHGQGIEQSQLDHIFEAFYRTREAQSSTIEGLGLGLAIAKQIVDLHEGRIWCISQQGHGCTFCVELPLKPQNLITS